MKAAAFMVALFFSSLCLAQGRTASDSLRRRERYISAGFAAIAYKGSLQSSYLRWTPAYQGGISIEGKGLLSSHLGIGIGNYIAEDRSYRLPAKADQNLLPVSAIEGNYFTLHYETRFLLFRFHGLRIQACQGIGLFRFTVKDRDGNNLSNKPKTRAAGENYSQNSIFFPTSMMISYRFPNRMGLGFQAGWFNTTSPFLDNMNQLSQNQDKDNLAGYRFHVFLPLN